MTRHTPLKLCDRLYIGGDFVRPSAIATVAVPLASKPNGTMGGVKRSGIGRELGLEGLCAYTSETCLTLEAG